MNKGQTNILNAFFSARNAYEQFLICYYAGEMETRKQHYDNGIAHIQRAANTLGYDIVKRESK